jgi:hypothetical protein
MKILVKILTSFIEIFVEFEIYDFQYLLTHENIETFNQRLDINKRSNIQCYISTPYI